MIDACSWSDAVVSINFLSVGRLALQSENHTGLRIYIFKGLQIIHIYISQNINLQYVCNSLYMLKKKILNVEENSFFKRK